MATVHLSDRACLRLSGPDARTLVKGLITNQSDAIAPGKWLYAALLTPQGKYLFDFFITQLSDGDLLFDCSATQRDALAKRLMMYRMRSKVEISLDDHQIWASFGDENVTPDMADPRHALMGTRTLTEPKGLHADIHAYTLHRLSLGIPNGPTDFLADKTLWLETNADYLNGVDFNKGCYVGQELTARMHYRGKVRRRLIPIRFDGEAIPHGTAITHNDRELGDVRSSAGGLGLANLKVEDLSKAPMIAGECEITPWVPDWLQPVLDKQSEPA